MPFIGNIRALATKLIGVLLPEFLTRFSDRFAGHFNPPVQHHLFDIAVAQREGVVEPDAVADNLSRELVAFVGIGRASCHESSISKPATCCQPSSS